MPQKIGDRRELGLRWINVCTLSIDPPILNFIVINIHWINKYERCPLKTKQNKTKKTKEGHIMQWAVWDMGKAVFTEKTSNDSIAPYFTGGQ